MIDAAVQMFGGRGVESGETVERLYREIRALRIYEGATEVQQLIIARDLLKSHGKDRRPQGQGMKNNEALLPEGWPRPKGYANGVAARGRQVFVAGQIGWDGEARSTSDDFVEQARQALANIAAVLPPAARSRSTSCA